MAVKKISVEDNTDREAMERALHLLKFRGRSESEMGERLAKIGFSADIVQKTVDRLRELAL